MAATRLPASGGSRHDDLIRALDAPGCAACRRATFAEERSVGAFVTAAYADHDMLERLRASLGFCPEHVRALLQRSEAPWVTPIAYGVVVRAAHERIETDVRDKPPDPCPMCRDRDVAVASWLRVLAEAATDPRVSRAYRASGGLCVAHARAALRWCDADGARLIVDVLADALATSDDDSVASSLVGADGDRLARAALRERLAGIARVLDLADRTGPLLDGVAARLAIDSCPICLGRGLAERRALGWAEAESECEWGALAAEGLWLCAQHLSDAQSDDAPAAARLAALDRRRVDGELAWLRDRLATLPARTLRERVRHAFIGRVAGASTDHALGARARSLVAGRRRALGAAVAPAGEEPTCFVCRAADLAEARELALLRAALDDAPTARRYEASHGACARHAMALAHGLVSCVALARLGVLHWELEEARRTVAWDARHETPRGEADAWLRVPGVIDGRAFLGGPAAPPC